MQGDVWVLEVGAGDVCVLEVGAGGGRCWR